MLPLNLKNFFICLDLWFESHGHCKFFKTMKLYVPVGTYVKIDALIKYKIFSNDMLKMWSNYQQA